WFVSETSRVYAILEESDTETEHRQVLEYIARQGGRITANDLRRRSRAFSTNEEAESFLRDLVADGRGIWDETETTPEGGRPTRYFRLTDRVSVSETPELPRED
ncbi:MAG: hypothetical protein ACYTG0_40250, partial [Planctomycetota bacterium]